MGNGNNAELVDDDGRTWVWDRRAKVWYAPDWGLELGSREEIEETYGIVSAESVDGN